MTVSLPFNKLLFYFLIYVRLSSAFVFLPFFSHPQISIRIKILFAMILSVFIVEYGVVEEKIFNSSTLDISFVIVVAKEVLIGVIIGSVAQFILSIFDVVGQIISFQIGLSNAMAFNPSVNSQTNILSNGFLIAFILIFISLDLHHYLLRGFLESYKAFPPGGDFLISTESLLKQVVSNISILFSLAIQVTLPFLIGGIIFQFILGLFNRVMPQIQIFFISLPLQLILGAALISATISGVYLIYLSAIKSQPTLVFMNQS
jgi:flagellar biosynthetic protein FliR